ncbi:MAG: SDR family oxidoreductase [Sphingobacteriaceae bacterium]|nr:MAG: SDR family oxidoreductase [Pedobacter sp.]
MNTVPKTVIITGASSGIGKACAEEYAKRGANLVLAARQYLVLCEIAQNLEVQFGINVLPVQCDVSKEEECKHLIQQAVSIFKTIDVLVNNAGISMRALFNDLDLVVLKKLIDVNFWGMVYCTKYALPELLKSNGSVVGISSGAAYHGFPGRTGYSASKFALNGFLEALRIENLKIGLHVLVAVPGFTASNIRYTALVKDGTQQGDTSMDEGKMMKPERVAQLLVEAINKRKRTLVITNQAKLMVLLDKIMPAWLDKLLYRHFTKEKDPLIV